MIPTAPGGFGRGVALVALAALLVIPRPALAAVLFVDDLGDGATGAGSPTDPYRDLETAIVRAADGDVIRLAPGLYPARPAAFVDSLCGNCEEHRTPVPATRGFVVAGKGLAIIGAGADRTVLETRAGYGMYFEDSPGSMLSGVRITGGRRDTCGMATSAGIVARRSRLTVERVEISGNTHRPQDVVVGIAGIVGREGAELHVVGSTIRDNGWDGVALYRGAAATIVDNVISDGRGAGIGITWDAVAIVLRNEVSGYWKGIGTFGSSRAVVRNNIVRDNLGWGIIATGTSFLEASNNVVTRNGNCGFAVWSGDATGLAANNIITRNGWRDEWVCPRVGVWVQDPGAAFELSHNDVWGNAEGEYEGIPDPTGARGNISADPAFADSSSFLLLPESPAVDAGHPATTDPDGGPADLGVHGGPQSLRP